MRILHSMDEFDQPGCVAVLGTFDGVHLGHARLIREAAALAGAWRLPAVALTFDRHPLSVLFPERAPRPLLTLEENLGKFEALGADYALVQRFTPEETGISMGAFGLGL